MYGADPYASVPYAALGGGVILIVAACVHADLQQIYSCDIGVSVVYYCNVGITLKTMCIPSITVSQTESTTGVC